jgi:hypothetical protein
VRAAEHLLGLGAGRPAGQQRLGLSELRVGGVEGSFELRPDSRRRPPSLWIGLLFEAGQLGLGEEQEAGAVRVGGLQLPLGGHLVQFGENSLGPPAGLGDLLR